MLVYYENKTLTKEFLITFRFPVVIVIKVLKKPGSRSKAPGKKPPDKNHRTKSPPVKKPRKQNAPDTKSPPKQNASMQKPPKTISPCTIWKKSLLP